MTMATLILPVLLFVGIWPLLMMVVWVSGALIFYLVHEAGQADWRELPPHGIGRFTSVSIVVPCFNEEENAEETLRACAAQVHPDFEIIAVNDGSRDGTAAVLDRLAAEIPCLRVIHLEQNQGKAIALRAAALAARGEILVCVDGDAILHPHCIAWLTARFAERPRLGAVTGNPRIRNRSRLLGLLQVGEFSATIGMIKRAQRLDGRIFTVSGVVVAFRHAALFDVNYWTPDNLTEDVDVTWKLQRRHWAVHYEPNALAYILMPETLRGLWRQRLRWAIGGSQTFIRYAPDLLRWRERRMWSVVAEYIITLVWCYAMVVSCFFFVFIQLGFIPDFGLPLPFLISIWGVLLSIACLCQLALGLLLERRYEPDAQSMRTLFWLIWYPLAFWTISAVAAVIAFPKAWTMRSGSRARWVSPDRGIR